MRTCVNRRKTSILPEIRVLAPSLERGLDDSWPLSSQSPDIPDLTKSPSLVHSQQIYQSHDDITDSGSCRYISGTQSDGTIMENHIQKLHFIYFHRTRSPYSMSFLFYAFSLNLAFALLLTGVTNQNNQ